MAEAVPLKRLINESSQFASDDTIPANNLPATNESLAALVMTGNGGKLVGVNSGGTALVLADNTAEWLGWQGL